MKNVLRLKRIRSKELRRRRRLLFILRIELLVLLLVSLVFLFSELSKWEPLRINEIEISGVESVSEPSLRGVVREELSGYYLGIFAKPNTLIFPRGSVERAVLNEFPRIVSTKVKMDGLRKVSVGVVERETQGLWCDNSTDVDSEGPGECYFLDDTGFLFAKAPTFSGTPFFKFSGGIEKAGTKYLRGQFLDPDFFAGTLFFIETLDQQLGLKAVELIKVDDTRFELVLEGDEESSENPRIIFNPEDGYTAILDNLETVLSSNEFVTEAGDRLIKIDYIDLRFGNKVFYKLEDL